MGDSLSESKQGRIGKNQSTTRSLKDWEGATHQAKYKRIETIPRGKGKSLPRVRDKPEYEGEDKRQKKGKSYFREESYLGYDATSRVNQRGSLIIQEKERGDKV